MQSTQVHHYITVGGGWTEVQVVTRCQVPGAGHSGHNIVHGHQCQLYHVTLATLKIEDMLNYL